MLVLNPTLMCAFIIRMHRPTTHPPLMLATEDYRRHEQEKRWCQWAANPWRGAWYRLPSLISEKCGQPYSTTISWIRCVITFSLTDSVIACLRTPKSSLHRQRSLCRSRATQSLSLFGHHSSFFHFSGNYLNIQLSRKQLFDWQKSLFVTALDGRSLLTEFLKLLLLLPLVKVLWCPLWKFICEIFCPHLNIDLHNFSVVKLASTVCMLC